MAVVGARDERDARVGRCVRDRTPERLVLGERPVARRTDDDDGQRRAGTRAGSASPSPSARRRADGVVAAVGDGHDRERPPSRRRRRRGARSTSALERPLRLAPLGERACDRRRRRRRRSGRRHGRCAASRRRSSPERRRRSGVRSPRARRASGRDRTPASRAARSPRRRSSERRDPLEQELEERVRVDVDADVARSARGRCGASGRRPCGRGVSSDSSSTSTFIRSVVTIPGRNACASATASWIGAPSQPYVRAWYCLKNSTSSATNVPTRPASRKRSAHAGVRSAPWVTSRPIIVTSSPEWKTR